MSQVVIPVTCEGFCLADVSTATVLDWFLSSKVATYPDDIKEDSLLNVTVLSSFFVALLYFIKLWLLTKPKFYK